MRISDWSSDVCSSDLEVVLDAVVAKDQRTIARDSLVPWLPAPGRVRVLVEVATGPAVAEPEIDSVLAADVRQRDRGVPLLPPEPYEVAHAQAELVRIRRLEVVAQQVDLAAATRVGRHVGRDALRRHQRRVERNAAGVCRRAAFVQRGVERSE